ncbi:nucleoside recognition domain-containing protein [Anoxybacillus geothermalis]|uniref:nucleoside recognition domain-containing protein n=1 Tax=Geobacillus sp. Manikaran-105 TaxID=2055940 RepID=UPI000B92B724|nr:nucleoside recognition domain-containing protein [Geobacillus sp. Manikaran-105]ASS85794.1 iron transporter FeoB [Geobacillus lituanicus]MED4878686.1 nucleoside recognition domain-containing protein [Anoxybacillus geothermalis]PJW14599.1 ferrous iron transporter B [Geobacillus sp. Manikaran-105]
MPAADLSNQFDQLMKEAKSLAPADTREQIVSAIFQTSAALSQECVTHTAAAKRDRTEQIDRIVTSKRWGFPIMLALLAAVLYMTIAGANVFSDSLARLFGTIETYLTMAFQAIHAPDWLHGLIVLGLYRGTAWVVSVMLPPMAIFFPVFALLENYGYLPRVAFNMDRLFQKAGAHGKQSLTMAMGFGCNAAAIMSTRIIESPRERMLAILTNNFVPCNGRWPTLILLSSLFMAAGYTGGWNTFVTAGVVVAMVLFGIVVTLTVSWVLSKTALRGIPTHYTLELPPYRRPKIMETIIRATLDKSLYVLKRAVTVAAPAGVITWILANLHIGDTTALAAFAHWLDPFAQSLGLDGYILMAFILGLPANEIVVPILLMGYLSAGALIEADGLHSLKQLLLDHGWTWLTALNMMLFSLLHYPCGTTLVNIYKETKSAKWTFVAFALPTAIAIAVTFTTAQLARWLGLV